MTLPNPSLAPDVIFYEKPGCAGNAQQKAVLRRSGLTLDVRDLLTHPWTAEMLRPFFGNKPVADWFNKSHPKIKAGEIDPNAFGEVEAIARMLEDPLLIRRPLIEARGRKDCGFNEANLAAWFGHQQPELPRDLEACPHGNEEPCPETSTVPT